MKEGSEIYYFAYGSNMSQDQMRQRNILFHSAEKGVLENFRLVFSEFLEEKSEHNIFANIESSRGQRVEGVIYQVDKNFCNKMDLYEFYPRDYIRKEMLAINSKNEEVKCIFYIANKENVGGYQKSQKEYVKKLLKGEKFLSQGYIEKMKNISRINK